MTLRILIGAVLLAASVGFAATSAEAACPPGEHHDVLGHCIWDGPNGHHQM